MKKPLGLFRKPLSYLLINTTHLNIAILSVLVFFLLPGCVEKKTTLKPEKKMTLEEAKRVTVSMSAKHFHRLPAVLMISWLCWMSPAKWIDQP